MAVKTSTRKRVDGRKRVSKPKNLIKVPQTLRGISDTSKNGGKLGWIPMSALNQKIKKELLNINIGDFTKPIVIPGGFLIIKINDARKIKDKIDIKKEVESVAERKTNEQLNQFSAIYFNKIKKNIKISEL